MRVTRRFGNTPEQRRARAGLQYQQESNHARDSDLGRELNPQKMSRQDYVNGKVKREANATVSAITTNKELKAQGLNRGISAPGESQYDAGSRQGVANSKKDSPDGFIIGRC